MARKKAIQEDVVSMDKPTVQRGEGQGNKLVLTLSSLRVFDPLTENQKKFFDAYKLGEYCMALLGSPGTGKCQGEDVEVNLLVSEELFDILSNMS